MTKPTLCIDFDGVIHRYSKGWQEGVIYDPVVPGFFDWARKAQEVFELVVYSSRSKTKAGITSMMDWMREQERTNSPFGAVPVELGYSNVKPAAFLTIDDRAIQFRGDWNAWWLKPETLRNFIPWNAGNATTCAVAEPNMAELVWKYKFMSRMVQVLSAVALKDHEQTQEAAFEEIINVAAQSAITSWTVMKDDNSGDEPEDAADDELEAMQEG